MKNYRLQLTLFPALLLAMLLPATAQVTHLLQSPQAPVPAGSTVEIILFVANDGPAPAMVEPPLLIPLIAATPLGTRAIALHRVDGEPEKLTVPVGGFSRVRYTVTLPSTVVGLRVLAAVDPTYGRGAIEVVAPPEVAGPIAPAPASAEPAVPAQGLPPPAVMPARRPLGVMPYEPVYFSLGAHEVINARFQLSLKIRPFGPADERIYASGSFLGNLYGAYTQTSLWDLESESKPFFDTSYKPTLFYQRYDTGLKFLGAQLGYSAGFEHESNGQGGTASRSMNLLTFRPTLRWDLGKGWTAVFSPKLYTYIEKEENADIPEYRGYGDYVFWVENPDSWKLAATVRLGTSGKGSVLLDSSYPIHKMLGDYNPTGWANGYLHLQYFNGYTESLRTYNIRTPWQVRVGYMIVR